MPPISEPWPPAASLLSVVEAQVSRAVAANLEFPVLAAAEGESQVQVPFEAVGPSVGLALDTTAGSFTIPLAVQPVSPAHPGFARRGPGYIRCR